MDWVIQVEQWILSVKRVRSRGDFLASLTILFGKDLTLLDLSNIYNEYGSSILYGNPGIIIKYYNM